MSNVSRAVYQKLAEENKRLLNDIRTLVELKPSFNQAMVRSKWQEQFERDKQFRLLLKHSLNEYYKKHPDKRLNPPTNTK